MTTNMTRLFQEPSIFNQFQIKDTLLQNHFYALDCQVFLKKQLDNINFDLNQDHTHDDKLQVCGFCFSANFERRLLPFLLYE